MTVEKPKLKKLLRPIKIGTNSAMNQSQFLAITCNSLKAREKSRVQGAIGFGLGSHWLKNWRESFKPITKRSNRNLVITFDSHLKTALCNYCKLTTVVPYFSENCFCFCCSCLQVKNGMTESCSHAWEQLNSHYFIGGEPCGEGHRRTTGK